MAYLTYKNVKISIDGVNEIPCNSISISTENSLSPRYVTNCRNPDGYYPKDGIRGNMNISYYLTGEDYFYRSIVNENNVIPVKALHNSNNISGYLSSYNLSLQPNSPPTVNANIVFFQEIPSQAETIFLAPDSTYNTKVLSTSDVNVDLLNGYSTENTQLNVKSVDFNYSCQVQPVYVTTTGESSSNPIPYRVVLGEKYITANIDCDNFYGTACVETLPITGKNAGIKITFRHPEQPNLSQSFTCSGLVTAKAWRSAVGDLIYGNISVIQHNIDESPSITGFDPLVSSPGSFIKISGRNFTNASSLYFHDREALRYNVLSDTLISGIVPYDALTGKIYVETYGGRATSSSNYNLTYPAMAINYVSPYTGFSGQGALISGNNFYRISHVFFGNKSGDFRSVNSGVVYGYIPSYAESGFVKVVSTGRGIFANSIHGYVPVPLITGYSPWTGMSGDMVRISGFGFSGVTAVRFNGINVRSFGVDSNILITGAIVHSGNVKGYITVHGASGVMGRSAGKFNPSIVISGIDPTSGTYGEFCRISGYNFQTGLMYHLGDGYFRVKVGNQITGFRMESFRSMTGLLPYNFIPGPVRIFQVDGSTFENTGNMGLVYQQPSITSFSPYLAVSGQSYYGYIQGANLFNVTGLRFIGTDGSSTSDQNAGRTYIVPMINDKGERVLRSDSLGLRVNISNYTGFVFPTGVADHPAKATGRFDLYLYTSQYSTSYTSNKLSIEKIANL